MRPVRLLLVEDHDFTRATLAAALRAEGFQVVASVPSARDAMAAVREYEVDCAVVDLDLGRGPTGIDLAYVMRDEIPGIALVLLTHHADRRLVSGDKRPLPPGTRFVVKGDVRSVAELREAIHVASSGVQVQQRRTGVRLPLTDVQMEIVRMLAAGLTNAEIAHQRGVSERSVQAAIGRIGEVLEISQAPGRNVRMQILRACGVVGLGSSRD